MSDDEKKEHAMREDGSMAAMAKTLGYDTGNCKADIKQMFEDMKDAGFETDPRIKEAQVKLKDLFVAEAK
jgi:hypothetical protein